MTKEAALDELEELRDDPEPDELELDEEEDDDKWLVLEPSFLFFFSGSSEGAEITFSLFLVSESFSTISLAIILPLSRALAYESSS